MTAAERKRERHERRLALAGDARTLRDRGMLYREIADVLGIGVSYAEELVSDPNGEKMRRRREKYAGKCVDCGARTYSGNFTPPERCRKCAPAHLKIWTREAILAAFRREWAETGEVPCASVWAGAGRPEWAPTTTVVAREFGSWNAGVRAAGLTPRKVGGKRGDSTAEERAAVLKVYAERGLGAAMAVSGRSRSAIQRWEAEAGVSSGRRVRAREPMLLVDLLAQGRAA